MGIVTIIYSLNYIFFFKDLRRAFSSVDRDNDGLVRTKDIPIIFTHLNESYKSFIIEGDDLKRLIDKLDIDGQFSIFHLSVVILFSNRL